MSRRKGRQRINAPLRLVRSDVNRGLCPSDKRSYPNADSALQAALTEYRKHDRVRRTYPCPKCGRHHLTKDVTEAFETEFRQKYPRKMNKPKPDWKAPKTKKKGWTP